MFQKPLVQNFEEASLKMASKSRNANFSLEEKLLAELGKQYSKNPHKRTCVLGVQADVVLTYRVFSVKLA